MKKVTVAVAVYNVEKYIERCIVSLLSQSFDDYEVLVVDDRGQDNSVNIVEQIAETHPNGDKVRIIHHDRNKGTGAVRNTSITEATGEFIFFMDGDDYLAPNAIQLLYESAVNNQADITMGSYQRVYPDGRIQSTKRYELSKCVSDFAIAQWMRYYQTNDYPVATWNKLFKVSFLKENDIKCVPWHRQEDILFALQTAFVTRSIVTIPDITYFWVQVNGSCTHSEMTEWHLNQYLDIFDRCMSLYEDVEMRTSKVLPKELYWIITNHYLWGFIAQNVCSSSLLSRSQKNTFFKHIRGITRYHKYRDEYSWRQKMIYLAIFLPLPYPFIRFLSVIRSARRK